MNISIIGGDLRIIRLAEMYAKDNYNVYTYGLEKYFDKEKGYSKQTEAKVYNKNINDEVHRSNEKFNNIFFMQQRRRSYNKFKLYCKWHAFYKRQNYCKCSICK